MLFINHNSTDPISFKIGNVKVTQVGHAKLLGVTFNEKQKWDEWNWRSHQLLESENFSHKKTKASYQPRGPSEGCRQSIYLQSEIWTSTTW